ncbi:MAG TPA: GGDEF domain-containing protein [Burkholderiales bacterium]|nr:GGDEF domain-containing protein [Burkholderiales bacterium]
MTQAHRYTLAGALLGACFPVLGLVLVLGTGETGTGVGLLAALARAHTAHPLLWVLDLAPVALALVFRVLGAREDRLRQEAADLRRRIGEMGESVRHAREAAQRAREHIAHMAGHDALTGVRNRHRIAEEVTRALKASRRYRRELSVLVVDVDRLRYVNETQGEGAGDKYLSIVAASLERALRETDTVGRWGDDEFLVLLPETGVDGAAIVCDRLLQLVCGSPVLLDDYQLKPSVSIGIALYPAHGDTPEKLAECANTAMETSRREGGARFSVFAPYSA